VKLAVVSNPLHTKLAYIQMSRNHRIRSQLLPESRVYRRSGTGTLRSGQLPWFWSPLCSFLPYGPIYVEQETRCRKQLCSAQKQFRRPRCPFPSPIFKSQWYEYRQI